MSVNLGQLLRSKTNRPVASLPFTTIHLSEVAANSNEHDVQARE